MENFAVIVAGGSGSRMGSDVPKQFLLLDGLPVLMQTIRRFHQAIDGLKVKLVLPEAHIQYWNGLVDKFTFKYQHDIVMGGDSRFQSVKNGLNNIFTTEGLVAIHDGVRPLVPFSVASDQRILRYMFSPSLAARRNTGRGGALASCRRLMDWCTGGASIRSRRYSWASRQPAFSGSARLLSVLSATRVPPIASASTGVLSMRTAGSSAGAGGSDAGCCCFESPQAVSSAVTSVVKSILRMVSIPTD